MSGDRRAGSDKHVGAGSHCRATTICLCSAHSPRFSKAGWPPTRERRGRAREIASRRRASARAQCPALRRTRKDRACRSRSPRRARSIARLRSSTRRWRRASGPAIAHSRLNCIAFAAKLLLKRDPANPAPAEEAFQTAIAVAKQQGARSFELRAALALAKLYQSPAARSRRTMSLRPRSKAFRGRRRCRRSGEAQALLAALEKADEINLAAASRRLRLKLQTSYGLALSLLAEVPPPRKSPGDCCSGEASSPARSTTPPRCLAALSHACSIARNVRRGGAGSARTTAEADLRDAKNAGGVRDVVVGETSTGVRYLTVQGAFSDARAHLQEGARDLRPRAR